MGNTGKKEKWKYWSEHPIISGMIVAVFSCILGTFFGASPVIERYFAIDTASTLIDSYLVDMDFVDPSILEEESLDQQFKMIHDSFVEYDNAIQAALVNMGQEQSTVSEMNRNAMLAKLPSLSDEMFDRCAEKDSQLEQQNERITALETEKAELQNQVNDYEQRKEAELLGSCLIIDGERMNNGESINSTIAKVDGHYYYGETFIEAYLLKEKIDYDVQSQTIIVGNSQPEKVKFTWDKMVYNPSGVDNYLLTDNRTFSMAAKSYSEGIVLSENDYFYVQLDGKYSKISFTYGHIDGTNLGDLELTFFAVDDNNESYTTFLQTIKMPGEMTSKEIEVPIGYAKTIKVVVSDGNDWDSDRANFGLTNIYLYS